jgi:hypothetical protein
VDLIDFLLQKIEESDKSGVEELVRTEMASKGRAWPIHLCLYPIAQRVLNPPFINPHLPKMYRVCREFIPYLSEEEIPLLVRLEISEYTRRPKLEKVFPPAQTPTSVAFEELEAAIHEGRREEAAALMSAFQHRRGKAELARRLLLLGSGYLDQTLGHSLSCTAFILLEMMERPEQESWPALVTLADYFCKGGFSSTPHLRNGALQSEQALDHHLLRATTGRGIVNLHHTITRFAVERVRHLLSDAEYSHLIACWVDFLGGKDAASPEIEPSIKINDYPEFYRYFSKREEGPVLASFAGLIPTEEGRKRLGRYLVRGVCDLYQGNYDPHYLTGLGSALWVVNRYWNRSSVALNALRQYLNHFFTHMTY